MGGMSLQEKYLKQLHDNVKAKTFDIQGEQHIPLGKTEVNTYRTIRQANVETGFRHWAILREFMQNSMDQLQLFERGRLNPALKIDFVDSRTLHFVCGDIRILTISTPTEDEFHITQSYTFPLHPDVLRTGICDITKLGADKAGGFGDGFKTAACSLLAEGEGSSLVWKFFIPGWLIEWNFESHTQDTASHLARQCHLNVVMERTAQDRKIQRHGNTKREEPVMYQFVKAAGIGTSFWKEAFPRLQVFWNLKPESLLSANDGQDFVGRDEDHSLVETTEPRGTAIKHPQSGVYVRGIWVTRSHIPGAIMCFSRLLNVNSRDRNDLNYQDQVGAVGVVFRDCGDKDLLRKLLSPLRGKAEDSSSTSWLITRCGEQFLNSVLEKQRDCIHDLLNIPRNALFVRETDEPATKWAVEVLRSKGSTVEEIHPGTNIYLFPETRSGVLVKRATDLIKPEVPAGSVKVDAELIRSAAAEIIKCLTGYYPWAGGIICSSHVKEPFCHKEKLFLPARPMKSNLLTKVVTECDRLKCNNKVDYSLLIHALYDRVPRDGIATLQDIKMAIKDITDHPKDGGSDDNVDEDTASQPTSDIRRSRYPRLPPREKYERELTLREKLEQKMSNLPIQEGSRFPSHIPKGNFAEDQPPANPKRSGHSALESTSVGLNLGGGELLVDNDTLNAINWGQLDRSTKRKICDLRNLLDKAIKTIKEATPSYSPILSCVQHGYDKANLSWKGMYGNGQIVINIACWIKQPISTRDEKTEVMSALILTLFHEMAHFLEPNDGHGNAWRNTFQALSSTFLNEMGINKVL